jgi:hypothetical protein
MDIEALADFAVGTEDFRLFAAKLDALRENIGRCKKYYELGFTPEIVLTVLRKKLDLVKAAITIKDTEKLKSPSAPIYDKYSGEFETDDTWVAEEELIQWSLVSMRAPLPPDACKRYFDLFQQTLGVDVRNLAQT